MDPNWSALEDEFRKHQKKDLKPKRLENSVHHNSYLEEMRKSLPYSKHPLRASVIERAALDESTIETRNNRSLKDLPFDLKVEVLCYLLHLGGEVRPDLKKKLGNWGQQLPLEEHPRRGLRESEYFYALTWSHRAFCESFQPSALYKLKLTSKNWNLACRHNFLWKMRYQELRTMYNMRQQLDDESKGLILLDPTEKTGPTCFHDAFLLIKKGMHIKSLEIKRERMLKLEKKKLIRRYGWFWLLSLVGVIICLGILSCMLEPKNFDTSGFYEGSFSFNSTDDWILDPRNPLNWFLGFIPLCFCIVPGIVLVCLYMFGVLKYTDVKDRDVIVGGNIFCTKVLGSLVVHLTLLCVFVHGFLESLDVEVNLFVVFLPVAVFPLLFLAFPFLVYWFAPKGLKKDFSSKIFRNALYYVVLALVLLWILQSFLIGGFVEYGIPGMKKFWITCILFIPSFLKTLFLIFGPFKLSTMTHIPFSWNVFVYCWVLFSILLFAGKLSGVVSISYPLVFFPLYVVLLCFHLVLQDEVSGWFFFSFLSVVCGLSCGLYWGSWLVFVLSLGICPCCFAGAVVLFLAIYGEE